MTETSKSDQCEPPSATETLRASLMGRKMCVVLEKFGRASLRVRGSGVCISMKAIEGRRRTMCEEGYLGRDSRSRYLRWLVWRRGGGGGVEYSSQNAMVCRISVRYFVRSVHGGTHIVCEPVILKSVDIFFRYYVGSAAALCSWGMLWTYIAHRNLQLLAMIRRIGDMVVCTHNLRYASSGAAAIVQRLVLVFVRTARRRHI